MTPNSISFGKNCKIRYEKRVKKYFMFQHLSEQTIYLDFISLIGTNIEDN